MNRAAILLLLLSAPFSLSAPVPPADKPPQGPSPQFVTIAGVDRDNDRLLVKSVVLTAVYKTTTQIVIKNGKQVAQTKTVLEHIPRTRTTIYPLGKVQVSTVDGKKWDRKDLERLKGKVVALVQSPTGLDPAYAKLLAKDTLVVTVQPSPSPFAPPPPTTVPPQPPGK
jgi:hypothetical protein